jgi:hypothetical protein
MGLVDKVTFLIEAGQKYPGCIWICPLESRQGLISRLAKGTLQLGPKSGCKALHGFDDGVYLGLKDAIGNHRIDRFNISRVRHDILLFDLSQPK